MTIYYYYYFKHLFMILLNGHNSANFEATISWFCMVIGLNKWYLQAKLIGKVLTRMVQYGDKDLKKWNDLIFCRESMA